MHGAWSVERRALACAASSMGTMTRRVLHFAVVAVVLPGILSLVVYYGFSTNYTGKVFHEAGFKEQYENDIYRYRILGPWLLLRTHELLLSDAWLPRNLVKVLGRLPASVAVLDPHADRVFYAAYGLLNASCLVLCSVALYSFVYRRRDPAAPRSRYVHLLGVLLIAITQFAVCPYDNLSYFFLLLACLLILRPPPRPTWWFPVVGLVVVLGTLSRESQMQTLAFFLAVHGAEPAHRSRSRWRELAFLVLVFAGTYGALRLGFGPGARFFADVQLKDNLSEPFRLAGILLLLGLSYALAHGVAARRRCLTFLAASTPYAALMILVARTWEVRLWVPIWLPLLLLAEQGPCEDSP